MSHSNRLIILSCLLLSSSAHAFDFFLDGLYWQANETVDWALVNNLDPINQNVSVDTIVFQYDPGFRVGFRFDGDWDPRLIYTRYYTHTNDSTNGNVKSLFLASRLAQPAASFYHAGQINFTINFNMFDADISKPLCITDALTIRPVIGLKGGWINQTIATTFQDVPNIVENTKNNFSGIGAKAGIESKFEFLRLCNYEFSLLADFTTSYMWGKWKINDVLHGDTVQTVSIVVDDRDFGALAFQGLVGINLDYKCFSMKLGYEISDWFNQYQVYDNDTGAHSNDLILQGLTLGISYHY